MNLTGKTLTLLFLGLIASSSRTISQTKIAGLLNFRYSDGQGGATYDTTYNHGGASSFGISQLTLFLDGDITDEMFFTGEIQSDLYNPNAEQTDFQIRTAAVTVTNLRKWRTNLQFGRFNTVFGTFPDRRLPLDNPLFDAPLAYSHRVNLDPNGGWVPPETLGNIRNFSIIDKELTQTGIKAFSRLRGSKLEYAFALTNNPVSNPRTVSGNNGLSASMRLHWVADHATSFGVSYSQGGYLNSLSNVDPNNATRPLPANTILATNRFNISAYQHRLLGAHWNWERDRYQVYTEFMDSSFDVPNNPQAQSLNSQSFYVESKYHFTKNFFGAFRFDTLSFDSTFYAPLTAGVSTPQKWDNDVNRVEVGMGTFVNDSTLAKVTYQTSDFDLPGNARDFNLLAGSVTVVF